MKPALPESIFNNLKFLAVEAESQVAALQQLIRNRDSSGNQPNQLIRDRRGYTGNLKSRIHNECYEQLIRVGPDEREMTVYRSFDHIAGHLERITELCRECRVNLKSLDGENSLHSKRTRLLLECVTAGIQSVERAWCEHDSELALKIAEKQQKLNENCGRLIERFVKLLKKTNRTEDLVAAILVIKGIQSMGEALTKISEAILSANLGQRISIDGYSALTGFASDLRLTGPKKKWALETIADTRSGNAVSGISLAPKQEIIAIFKDGKKRKLKDELNRVEKWHEIMPGIAPRILSYQMQRRTASLLIEHLQGKTYESILLEGSDKLQKQALKQLTGTLDVIWKKTLRRKPVNAGYIKQLQQRLPEVCAVHPQFQLGGSTIAGIEFQDFDALLERANAFEQKLAAPFSIYIHGDFNTDNIIYDRKQNKIYFIDLHRSRYLDYVQDISVFLVSNYRLQVLDRWFRQRVLLVNLAIYRFAADFADRNGDSGFELRLALGLARSLATSTRFIRDKTQAKDLFFRARFLIDQIVGLKRKQIPGYRVPIQELFVG